MENFLKMFHSGWAYLFILMGIIFLITTLIYFVSKKQRDGFITRISFITTLVFHVQLILGIILYFVSPITEKGMGNMGEAMKNSSLRFYMIEHPLMMISAVIFITIANAKLKGTEKVTSTVLLLVLFSVVCSLSRIPWATWLPSIFG